MMGKSLPDPISGVMNNGTRAFSYNSLCKKNEVLDNMYRKIVIDENKIYRE